MESVLVPYDPPAIVRVRSDPVVPTDATCAFRLVILPFPEFVGDEAKTTGARLKVGDMV
jgi:hypothetical protein